MLSSNAGGGDGDDIITINILSALPEGEPQGSFSIRVSPRATGRDLLRLVCKEARVPLDPNYVLSTSEGGQVPMDKPLLSVSCIQEGRNLHWNTYDSPHMAGGGCWNSYWFMALLSLLIGCAGIIAITYIYTHKVDNTQYGIVFDAGSSHTSMFIYRWEDTKINLTAVAVQDGAKCTANGGGISSYTNNTAGAGRSLVKCLDSAKGRIPTSQHGSTPVYLGATAGMRLLQKENPNASKAVLESIRNTIGNYPFKFTDAKNQVRILTGSEEGAFAWITSNYITGSFSVHPPSDAVVPDLIVNSVGALDLGGASTQITFIPNHTQMVPQDFRFDMSLYGSNYSLYAHSFLCYGVIEAAVRLQAVLIQAANFSSNVSNPCGPRGSVVNVTHKHIFSSACVGGQDALFTFGHVITAPNDVLQENVYFLHGESNATACRALVSDHLFNFTAACPYSRCSFNGVYQPPVFGDFYAFSSYFYLMEFLNLTSTDVIGYTDFITASQSLCAMDWQQVKKMKTSVPQNLLWYCFQSIYVDTILVDGYDFDPNTTWRTIHFVESISGMDAGWTLGFIINESHELPVETVKKDITTVTFSLLVVLFSAFIILALFFVRWARRQQRVSRRSFSFQANRYGAI